MAGALFLTDQTDQDRSGLIWISQNLQKKELQTRHTASRWPAPGTHAGSHLCTVPLAKDKDRVQEASRPPSCTQICSFSRRRDLHITAHRAKLQAPGHFWIRTCLYPFFRILLGTTVNSNSSAPEFQLGPREACQSCTHTQIRREERVRQLEAVPMHRPHIELVTCDKPIMLCQRLFYRLNMCKSM